MTWPAGGTQPAHPADAGDLAKELFDRAAAAALLVPALPVLAVLVPLIRVTSPGPAFYTQTRVGRNGRPFGIWKLRTMYHECERATGPRWSTPNDPRVTRLGRFLRATHLDELPQLWNVLRGEMSLVGPRPERPEFVDQLQRVIPRYRDRLQVRPGVTGLAQIQVPADTTVDGVHGKVAYDLYYIASRDLYLDLRILAGTFLKVMCVPFPAIRRLLTLPTPEAVTGSGHAETPAPSLPTAHGVAAVS